MMDRLRTLLDKLAETLRALDDVLAQEQQLLCADELPGVALQRVTDSKSQLLATVAWLEQQRPALEANLALRAPYQGHESFSERWRQIQQLSQSLREKNQHNGLLLNQQIAHNQQALAILSKNNKSLYGPDGQSRAASLLGRKIGV
ncbi:flagellar biosynthesis protein FlgN [Klebsiella aerogenes]|jgi:flagella synthesis protein FlgN|uniref:FlgN family protein n=3 Tax=Enterobacteriaceae TaxID=543 RepID=A0A0H3FYQ9_KLEAK|nr:FlgN family protein [Klebsiella aerogenes KCTC 2190]AMH11667.2 flagellar biosynthesis protein FlgN [Klebsiella aerogenes]AMQ61490.2 flagellar biosynthesis protein FlgN [Klebsiella aerogenes]ATM90742.1 flagellar biosynthesis protein FlgN [Klebsiella aerogenes]ATY07122.1 flagellar biosynthesis protein FlgN [Klebsiella aerogenes]